ncbi:MAG TPA: IclR family transcriptional regulator [Rhizobiales bacterium]|nr:IclR family transcriptional regulator [Hyphomicrobiales bacterium]
MTAKTITKGSIARAAQILDALAASADGKSLSEIARITSFSKTTVHRVLASLIDVGFVVREPQSRSYRLGSILAEIGRAAAQQEVSALSGPILRRLAEYSSDTVFMSIPEGSASVCIERMVGSFPIRTLTLDRGDRRPLGVGAGSLALYCVMPEPVRRTVCQQNREWMDEFGDFNWTMLEACRDQYLELGYALNRGGVIPGMSAVAVPVLTRSGRAAAALTIAAINERMTDDRIEAELVPALKQEAKKLSQALSGQLSKAGN